MMKTFQDGKRNSIEGKALVSQRDRRSSIDSSPYNQDFVVDKVSIQHKVMKELSKPRPGVTKLSPLRNLEGIEMARKLRESQDKSTLPDGAGTTVNW